MEDNALIINEIKKNYDIDIQKISLLDGGWINKKYIVVDKNNNKYVFKELSLTKFPNYYLNVLKGTVDVQNTLYESNIKVPKVIINNKSKYISKVFDNKYFFMQEYVEGDSNKEIQLSKSEIEDIGRNLAMMHKVLKRQDIKIFKSKFLKYKTINALLNEYKSRKNQITIKSSKDFIEELGYHKRIIEDIKKSKFLEQRELQLIHGDFTPDNIVLKNKKVICIIDFELVRINSTLQDIGRIILSTCFINNSFEVEKLKSFINGYSKELPIKKEDIVNSIKMVWINESNFWIQDRYFNNYNPAKVEKFIQEIKWISRNWFNLSDIIKEVIKNE